MGFRLVPGVKRPFIWFRAGLVIAVKVGGRPRWTQPARNSLSLKKTPGSFPWLISCPYSNIKLKNIDLKMEPDSSLPVFLCSFLVTAQRVSFLFRPTPDKAN